MQVSVDLLVNSLV